MFDLVAPFIVGFLGSFHCLGMCGPLVVAYALHLQPLLEGDTALGPRPWKSGLLHHAAFHSGRLLTYGLLGLLTSGVVHLIDLGLISFNLRTGVTLLGGVLMIFAGLTLLRVIPFSIPSFIFAPGLKPFLNRWIPPLFRSQYMASKLALGILTGFLPCMLSWSMVLKAATTENIFLGFMTMVLFGLGTVPVLFLTGLSASMISMKMRSAGERIAAFSVIFMGLILILKGVRSFV
jgi:uncharacterized protein